MNISKKGIVHFLQAFSDDSALNRVAGEKALAPACAGMRMYEAPLVGVSSARDALYNECKKPHVVGENHMLPSEWMGSAKSVISIFNPFTRQIKTSNTGGVMPSLEWRGKGIKYGYDAFSADHPFRGQLMVFAHNMGLVAFII